MNSSYNLRATSARRHAWVAQLQDTYKSLKITEDGLLRWRAFVDEHRDRFAAAGADDRATAAKMKRFTQMLLRREEAYNKMAADYEADYAVYRALFMRR